VVIRKGRLEEWQEINLFGKIRMTGFVYECDTFDEGEETFTSGIVKYHSVMGKLFIETESGSSYELGTPVAKDKSIEEIINNYKTN